MNLKKFRATAMALILPVCVLEAATDNPKPSSQAGAGKRSAGATGSTELTREVPQGLVHLSLSNEITSVSQAELVDWVDRATNAVGTYYGRFPVSDLKLTILPGGPGKIHSGVEYGGRRIVIKVGSGATSADLARDWMLTHEMIHLGFPEVARQYHWMEEGLATYLEPIARARVGDLKPESVWKDLVEGLPQGLPQAGDRGLDRTPTWGRTYWGGALFWMLADIEIRKRTDNRFSLNDAIRGIGRVGGNGSVQWSLEKVLEEGDRPTGMAVLADLHRKMGSDPVDVDLPALWKELGIIYRRGQVSFDAAAPLAKICAAITSH